MTVETVTREAFDDLLAISPWLIVNFVREGCPWCAKLGPALDALSADLACKVPIIRLDRANSPDVVERFAVKSFPTTILFKNGGIREVQAGGGDEALAWVASLVDLAEA